MYGRPYLYVAVGVLLVGILLQQVMLVSIGVLSLLTLGIAWGWQRSCLVGVTYTRHLAEDHAFWGERMGLDVALTNFKLLPLSWLESDEVFPRQLPFVGEAPPLMPRGRDMVLGHTTAMRWFERITWHYEFECRARGLYTLGPVTLRSGDIFGLFSRDEVQAVPARLYVYPKLLDLPELGLPPRQPFGDLRAQRRLLEDPLRT
ncbi:MAG TPA: DUF58 domain-containing protein, partial [Chloroflexia bacterium]|nr:DUF58 domain-containing protein [Chloroflexia bacterium]